MQAVTGGRESAPRAVVLHGTLGHPEENWFPWLREKLTARGWQVWVPSLPTPEGHSLAAWLAAYDAQCPQLKSVTALVGHSVGVALACRLVEREECELPLLLSAAGCVQPLGGHAFDAMNASFFVEPFAWATIRARARSRVCLVGDDDPLVPAKHSEQLADALAAQTTTVPRGGHLNEAAGFVTLPQALQVLLGVGDAAPAVAEVMPERGRVRP